MTFDNKPPDTKEKYRPIDDTFSYAHMVDERWSSSYDFSRSRSDEESSDERILKELIENSPDQGIHFTQTDLGRRLAPFIKSEESPSNANTRARTEIGRIGAKITCLKRLNHILDGKIRAIIDSAKVLSMSKKREAANHGKRILDNMLYVCALERESLTLSDQYEKTISREEWVTRENMWISTYNKENADYQNLLLWLKLDDESVNARHE